MRFILYVFVTAAGCSSAIQAGANAQLRRSLDQPLLAALCVYGSAFLALLVAIPFTRFTDVVLGKIAQVPWWAWLGGVLSITSTMAALVLAQRMGSLFFTAATVTCSLSCAVLLDHLGWVGFDTHPMNAGRLAGCAFLLAGLYLVSKF